MGRETGGEEREMNWHTETRKVSELKEWDINPRLISKEEYKSLKESMNKLGNWDSLVINTDGTVIAGNQRLKIHKERGDSEVEVKVPDRELSLEEIKEIGVKSNRHSGEWDMDKLANEFEDLLGELGFDDLIPVNFGDKNEEIDLSDFDNQYRVTLKYEEEEYNEVLSLLSAKAEQLNQETNEELILYLLRNAQI